MASEYSEPEQLCVYVHACVCVCVSLGLAVFVSLSVTFYTYKIYKVTTCFTSLSDMQLFCLHDRHINFEWGVAKAMFTLYVNFMLLQASRFIRLHVVEEHGIS